MFGGFLKMTQCSMIIWKIWAACGVCVLPKPCGSWTPGCTPAPYRGLHCGVVFACLFNTLVAWCRSSNKYFSWIVQLHLWVRTCVPKAPLSRCRICSYQNSEEPRLPSPVDTLPVAWVSSKHYENQLFQFNLSTHKALAIEPNFAHWTSDLADACFNPN